MHQPWVPPDAPLHRCCVKSFSSRCVSSHEQPDPTSEFYFCSQISGLWHDSRWTEAQNLHALKKKCLRALEKKHKYLIVAESRKYHHYKHCHYWNSPLFSPLVSWDFQVLDSGYFSKLRMRGDSENRRSTDCDQNMTFWLVTLHCLWKVI